jgi:hypothetical protein
MPKQSLLAVEMEPVIAAGVVSLVEIARSSVEGL